MTTLSEPWLQVIASRNNLPALRPSVVSALLPVVEMQLRKIVQQAYKFTRRGKGGKLTVDDINLALELYHLEPLYGLVDQRQQQLSTAAAADNFGVVSLVQLARAPLPKCPLLPELSLHWLAVEGVQPLIPENPSQAVAGEASDHPSSLPRELQQFYLRVTGVLLASESGDRPLRAVLTALRDDSGLQDLVPYFSKFIYHHVKANARALPLLRTLMSAVQALLANPGIRVEFHLQQMLPAIFTAIVAAKLSSSPHQDHWSLRAQASAVIAAACIKYAGVFPELQARVCKTYLDALAPDKPLPTLCGGLLGLSALGQTVARSLLLPRVAAIGERLERVLRRRLGAGAGSGAGSGSGSGAGGSGSGTGMGSGSGLGVGEGADGGASPEALRQQAQDSLAAGMCLAALAAAMGQYLAHSLRLGIEPSLAPLVGPGAAGAVGAAGGGAAGAGVGAGGVGTGAGAGAGEGAGVEGGAEAEAGAGAAKARRTSADTSAPAAAKAAAKAAAAAAASTASPTASASAAIASTSSSSSSSSSTSTSQPSSSRQRTHVAGLEEVLAPYYASVAAGAAHLRLFV